MATFKINVDVNNKSVNQLEEDLQTLEAQFKQLKIGDPGFKQLGNQIKGIRSQLKDVELQFEGLDKEQRATALVDTFTGLTGAVGAVSSAFLAFGVSSQAIDDAEKKILGVLGVVSGLRDASNGLIAANKLIGSSFTDAFKTADGAIKGTKVALASLGVGALITAVGYLIATFDDWKGILGLTNTELEFTAEEFATIGKESSKLIVEVESLTAAVTDQTLSEKERQKALKTLEEKYPNYFKNLGDDINNTTALTAAKEKLIETIIKEATVKAARNKIEEATAKNIETQISLGAEQEANTKRIQELNAKGTKRSISEGVELANLKRRQIQINDELTKSEEEQTDTVTRLNEIIKKNTEQIIENGGASVVTAPKIVKGLSDEEKELKAVQERLEEIEKLSKRLNKEFEKQFELVPKGIETKIKPALDEYGNVIKGLPNPFEGVTIQYEQSAQIFRNGFDQFVTGLKASAYELTESTKQALSDFSNLQETIARQGLESGKLTEAEAEKAFERSKKLRKANVLIDSSQAAIGIFTSSTSLPEPFATANRIIQLAALSAATAASIKQIDATTLSGGGAGAIPSAASYKFGSTTSLTGGGTYGGTVPVLPGTGGPGPGGYAQTGTMGEELTGGRVIKTYVLAGDVTSAQQADAKIKQKRKL